MGRRKKSELDDYDIIDDVDLSTEYDDLDEFDDTEDELFNEDDTPNIKPVKEDKNPEIAEAIKTPINENGEKVNPDYGKDPETLILENENFAYSIVNKEFSKYSWDAKEDLYSAAKFGLVYAASKYDSKQNEAKFISYAVNWIRYYVHEEVRKFNPIKLNQNFVCKRNKIKKAINKFKEENDREPSIDELSKIVGMSPKVIHNVYGLNGGENYNFVSFQAMLNPGTSKDQDDGTLLESKLTNEYVQNALDTSGITNFEVQDLLEVLSKKVSKEDYNIFVDKYINGLSYSDIAKKYNLNFASSASYKLKCIEQVVKKLVE